MLFVNIAAEARGAILTAHEVVVGHAREQMVRARRKVEAVGELSTLQVDITVLGLLLK